MSKDRQTIFRFAVVGFGVAVVWLVCHMLANPSQWSALNNALSVMFIISCPPVLLTFPLIDAEIGTVGTYLVWTVVALLNAALYAAIGSAYVGLRKKREGGAAS